MRTLSGVRRKARKKWPRKAVKCTGVHYPALVNARLRTSNYSQEARSRLGDAVAKAREAAGYRWRTAFARAADVSVRSLVNLEQGKPGLGQAALYAIARALPGWNEDTPREILEGGPIPEPQSEPPRPNPRLSPVLTSHPDDPAFWVALADEVPKETFDELWKIYQDRRRLLAERSHSIRSDLLDQSRSEDDSQ